jgi:hypothetical protein
VLNQTLHMLVRLRALRLWPLWHRGAQTLFCIPALTALAASKKTNAFATFHGPLPFVAAGRESAVR